MASCLGLYIQDNLIKYAKVTKDKDNIKVENFGVKFYDDIHEAVKQIVSETYSYKIPIATNCFNENYNYFQMFSLLSKNDLKKSIDTEFESFCYEKGYNRNTLEERYALVPDLEDKQKIRVIHINNNKLDVGKRLQQLEDNNVSTIVPLPMAITNILEGKEKENALIVNIEDKTTITTIIDQKIYDVDIIEGGAKEILDTISERENSYSKAYEICKNTTIYTMEGRELQSTEDNMYLQDIMPILYNIVEKLQTKLSESTEKFQKIYITGTGAVINNVDLYFQEYFTDCRVEVLRPYFIPETVIINMKDYIEVNSAIALGLQGLGNGIKEINFKKPALSDKLPDWLKIGSGNKKDSNEKQNVISNLTKKVNLDTNFKNPLDNTERWLVRTITGILSFIIIYTITTGIIAGVTNDKIKQTDELNSHTQGQIKLVEQDIETVNNKTNEYKDLLENIQKLKDENNEYKKWKYAIPNFLIELMYAVPKGTQITSIKNTTGCTMRITTRAKLYSQHAYLVGSIKTGKILYDVTSSQGQKSGNLGGVILNIIEGNLFDD